ncbi:transcription factor Adf-1-like [Haemaphysalis longicornis]
MGKWRCVCYPRDRPRREFNERLIAEVEDRPALWDTRSCKYRNIFVKHSDWKSVADALMTTETAVQMRWKNLRDTFLRKVRELEATNGTDAMPMIRWSYFSRLMFLRHSDYDSVDRDKY